MKHGMYCPKDHRQDRDLYVCICVRVVSMSVFSVPKCAPSHSMRTWSTSGGATFQGGPSSDCRRSGEHGQRCVVCVFEEVGVRDSCKKHRYRCHHAWLLIRDALYTRCGGERLFPLPLMPVRWALPADGEQCRFCAALSRLRKSAQSSPVPLLSGVHVLMLVCVCACTFLCRAFLVLGFIVLALHLLGDVILFILG